jgi:hypothetical protein
VSPRKARRRPQKTTEPAAPPLAERLQSEREQLFLAMGIIMCARYATASKWTDDIAPENMASALEAAYDLIDKSAGELGVMCDEQERHDVEHEGPQS